MSWRTTSPMDERKRFIQEWRAAAEPVTALCARYGISRKTGYKLLARYEAEGWGALSERSRARHHQPHAVSRAVERAVVEVRGAHPRWGPRKVRAWLQRRRAAESWPAASTIGAVLKRHGLVGARQRHGPAAPATQPLAGAVGPNDVWSTDFKGWFRTGDGQRCLPFTLTDNASRYVLRCQAVPTGDEAAVRPLVEAAFREYGLPRALRSDNGPPFASTAVAGLTALAVWWIRLGIVPERIAPGHPEQNGRHERFHLTLQQETAQPPAATGRGQQRRFDAFRREFNEERPHEGIALQVPAALYTASPRPYPARLPAVEYPGSWGVRRVRSNGEIRWAGALLYVSAALRGEDLGLEEVHEDCWRVRFGPVVLGWVDTRRPTRSRRRPAPKLLPMCPV